MIKILDQHTSVPFALVDIGSSTWDIADVTEYLMSTVQPKDIILCPWAIPGNLLVDGLFHMLSEICNVVVAAGNTSELIDSWSPTRADGVIVVGSLNKSGQQATHSNFSNTKKLEWVVGTNYHIGNETQSGTSVAATIYAAFLAESIEAADYSLVNKLNDEYFAGCKIN